jgi:hypothetical protein
MASSKSTPASKTTHPSASSRSSLASSTRDNSIGYDTPATSAVATPAAEGSFTGRRRFKLGGVALNASNKRKRNNGLAGSSHAESSRAAQAEAVDMSMDAQLARRLQAEEYGDEDEEEDEALTAGRSDAMNDYIIEDSDEEMEPVRIPFTDAINSAKYSLRTPTTSHSSSPAIENPKASPQSDSKLVLKKEELPPQLARPAQMLANRLQHCSPTMRACSRSTLQTGPTSTMIQTTTCHLPIVSNLYLRSARYLPPASRPRS